MSTRMCSFTILTRSLRFGCALVIALSAACTSDQSGQDDGGVTDGAMSPGDGPMSSGDSAITPGDGSVTVGVPPYITAAPAGEWTAIGENTLGDVEFDYVATPPPDGYRTSFQGIMDAWSGAAYAGDRHRLYINGGGHRDYDGNEWYAFDVGGGRWERVNKPSLFLESSAVMGVFPDGAPIPIHTYDCLVYAPSTHSLYRMGIGGSNLSTIWEFNLDTLNWRDTGSMISDPHGGTAAWDPGANQIFLLQNAPQAAGYAVVYRFDPATSMKTQLKQYGPTMGSVTGSFDTVAGELVYTGNNIAPIRVNAATGDSTPVTTTGDKSLEAIGGPGFAYDSKRNRFTGWGAGDTRTLFHLSKTDWSWTTETPSSGATPGAINTNGVFGRFQYLPEYDVFILVTKVGDKVMLFKPTDWAPPT